MNLEDNFLPFGTDNCVETTNLYFKQDRASINRSNNSLTWIFKNGERNIEWPAMYPDLNII